MKHESRALQIVRKYFPDVRKVNDATARTVVEVLPRDVANSAKKNHAECAMAVACKRSMKLDGVLISVRTAYLIKDKVATRYSLPEAVAREVVSFDRGSDFTPGTYKMNIPERKLGDSHGSQVHNGNGKPAQHKHLTKNIRTILGSDSER